MNRLTVLLAVISACCFGFNSTFAGIGDWHNYTYSEDATAIASDSQRIFCGTTGGLILYNGANGSLKKFLNSEGIGDVGIKSVAFDSAGNLFAGGSNGTLTKITPDNHVDVYNFEYRTGIRYFLVDLFADGGVLWVATEIGVGKFLINHGGGEFQDIASQLGQIPLETQVRAVVVMGNYIWAGTQSGLAFMEKHNNLPQNPDNWRSYRQGESGLTNANIYSLIASGDTLFAGTPNGVFIFGSDSLWANIGLTGTTIFSLGQNGGIINAATDNGVYRRSESGWTLIPNDSLKSTRAKEITYDSEGNLWAAFNRGGFAKFNGSFWEIYRVPGPASDAIVRIAIDSSKTAWLTHDGAGLTSFDGANWINYNSSNSGLRGNGAYTIEYDKAHNSLWIGSWGDGLFNYNLTDSIWENYRETNSPFHGVNNGPFYIALPALTLDSRNNIWTLNLDGVNPSGGNNTVMAAFNHDDSLWQVYYENSQQIPDNSVKNILIEDNDLIVAGGPGAWWLNFGADVFSTDDDTWHGKILDVTDIRAMVLDDSDRLIFGSPGGLAYYSFASDDTVILDLPDGYRSTVKALELDGLGNIWVGTDSGVAILPKNFQRGNIEWINKFKVSNSPLINNTVNSIKIDKSNGLVYIGTAGGLSIYESGNVQPSANLTDMNIYPNPANVRSGDTRVYFLRVPAESEISVYTVSGDLIKRFIYSGSSNYWDLSNQDNQPVAAGVYFFHVKSNSQSGAGKIAVIR
jgi:ligand-binding sensor domain-containing protein